MLLEIKNLKHYVADRLLLNIEHLTIYNNEKIALIGKNGSGKTTLLNLIKGFIKVQEGYLKATESVLYLKQISTEINHLSGGEKAFQEIIKIFESSPKLILADEPNNHLDENGLYFLKKQLVNTNCAVILVCHNRELINEVCQKIIEIEGGEIKVYNGNYNFYEKVKEEEKINNIRQYENYQKEKKRLKKAVIKQKEKSNNIKKTPTRMGNSEARLHKMNSQRAKANLDKSSQGLNSRLMQLNKVAKPQETKEIIITLKDNLTIKSPVILEGFNINLKYNEKTIFKEASFILKNGFKTALLGPNGSGKSSLFKMIVNRDTAFTLHPNLKIGYFEQNLNILNLNKTLYENIETTSIYEETFNRTVLANLLFLGDDVFKKTKNLSGGEKNKLALAMLILGNYNLLILDEPTNFMDLDSIKAVETALKNYKGSVLFCSHDKHFTNKIADEKWAIKENKFLLTS